MKHKTPKPQNCRAMSMVELMLVIAGVGTLAAIVMPVVQNVRTNAYNVKLDSSIAVLNSAVKSYLANGGEIPTGADIETVVAKLKTIRAVSSAESASSIAFGGSFIDRRIELNQDSNEAKGIGWNDSLKRFVMDDTADRYYLAMAENPTEVTQETRKGSVLGWGDEWIWGFEDTAVKTQINPTLVSLTPNPVTEEFEYSGPSIRISPVSTSVLTVGANSAVNAGFEGSNGINARKQTWGGRGLIAWTTQQENVGGWNTTASDGRIEVWQSGFNGVDSYENNFHVEFNANEVSTLWQEVDVDGMDVVNISFAHGQRSKSTEQLRLMVGPQAPATKGNSRQVEDLDAQGFEEVMITQTNAVGGWQIYSDVLEISEDIDTLYFAFQSVGEFAGRSYGNFLDDVRFEGATRATLDGLGFEIGAGNSISNVIQSAKIRLEDPEIEDDINISSSLPEGFELEKTFGADFTEITITGQAFRHEYAEILGGIAFTTSSTETHDRKLLFTVNDGYAVSTPAEYLVEFE